MKIKKYAVCAAGAMLLPTTVLGAGPWPTGGNDSFTTDMNDGMFMSVLENDSGNELRLTGVSAWTSKGGTARLSSDNQHIYYVPKNNFSGEDVFWYNFEDDEGRSNFAEISVTVRDNGSNNGNFTGWPVALEDRSSTERNLMTSVAVLDNDLGQSLQLTEVNDWTQKGGRAWISGTTISYQPPSGETGQDEFWYVLMDSQGRSNSAKVTMTISGSDDGGGTEETTFDLIPMQSELLLDTNFQYFNNQPEPGGLVSFNVEYAAAGATRLKILGGPQNTLIPNQLITYRSTDGSYYTNAIASIEGNDFITLKRPLAANVASGNNLSNFYNDGSHPNTNGFRAIADFALRELDDLSVNADKHVLLGDSWFSKEVLPTRLQERLSNAQIVNKGVGGNTTEDLLARFDQDVTPENPDVVWIIAGTNDYYQNVSKDTFVNNMKTLIEKIEAIGARPVVIDSSLAPLMWGNDAMLNLSRSYAAGLAEILAD